MATELTKDGIRISLKSMPVRYLENGFRIISAEETMRKLESLLGAAGPITKFEKRVNKATKLPYYRSYFRDFAKNNSVTICGGKGLSEIQSKVSAGMEAVERYCARIKEDEMIIETSYNAVKQDARDPNLFILPTDTNYHPDLKLDWVWGYSLTYNKPVLVCANFVFCPYISNLPEGQICDYSSNGLAAGNCLEEAILHGLFEVIERDALIIMEYNRLIMPDISVDSPINNDIFIMLNYLDSLNIRCSIKYITNNIPIHTFGVFLEGEHNGESALAYAAGTHPCPQITLSRALTEALQLYPRCINFDDWVNSGSIDHLYKKSAIELNFEEIVDLSVPDLKSNIEKCIEILKKFDAEVIVVNLSRPEVVFPVVRVLVTNLQPIINCSNPRFSKRLFEVPVIMSWRKTKLRPGEINLRNLCGII